MTALERFSSFVVGYRPDQHALDGVRLHAADTIGAWIAATGTDEGQALIRLRKSGAQQLVDHLTTSCAQARLSEIDDIHRASMMTPGAIVVPATMIIAGSLQNVTSDEIAAAMIGGYEAMVRLGMAMDGPAAHFRGIWPTYFAAPFGVAAVAARLLKLNESQTAHALALALMMASSGIGHHMASSTARWLAVGNAAGRGWTSALAAQAGFTSDLKLADGEFLQSIYGVTPNATPLSDGVGELALDQVSFKPWCAARQTMAATQALRELLADGVAAKDISAIRAAVLPPQRKMIDHGVMPNDRFSHLTSLSYNMAVAAIAPEAAFAINPPARVVTPDLQSFMSRVEVVADDALLDVYPKHWPAEIVVTTSTGQHTRRVVDVPGDPSQTFDENALRTKFLRFNRSRFGDRTEAMFANALTALEQPSRLLQDIEALSA